MSRKAKSTLLMTQYWRHSKHSLGLVCVTDGTDHIYLHKNILTDVLLPQFFQAHVRILP